MVKEKIKELVSRSDDGNNKKKIENLVFFLIILIVVLVAIKDRDTDVYYPINFGTRAVYIKEDNINEKTEQNNGIGYVTGNTSAKSDNISSFNPYLASDGTIKVLLDTIITYYKVSKAEAQEIEQNAQYALINVFNSHNLNFGEELDQTKVIEVILQIVDLVQILEKGYNLFIISMQIS